MMFLLRTLHLGQNHCRSFFGHFALRSAKKRFSSVILCLIRVFRRLSISPDIFLISLSAKSRPNSSSRKSTSYWLSFRCLVLKEGSVAATDFSQLLIRPRYEL